VRSRIGGLGRIFPPTGLQMSPLLTESTVERPLRFGGAPPYPAGAGPNFRGPRFPRRRDDISDPSFLQDIPFGTPSFSSPNHVHKALRFHPRPLKLYQSVFFLTQSFSPMSFFLILFCYIRGYRLLCIFFEYRHTPSTIQTWVSSFFLLGSSCFLTPPHPRLEPYAGSLANYPVVPKYDFRLCGSCFPTHFVHSSPFPF